MNAYINRGDDADARLLKMCQKILKVLMDSKISVTGCGASDTPPVAKFAAHILSGMGNMFKP